MPAFGASSASRFTVEIPSMPGRRTSTITTPGLWRLTASSASSPEWTVSTRSMSGVPARSSARPSRTDG